MVIQNRTISVALTCTQGQRSTQSLSITNTIEVTILTCHQLRSWGGGARASHWPEKYAK